MKKFHMRANWQPEANFWRLTLDGDRTCRLSRLEFESFVESIVSNSPPPGHKADMEFCLSDGAVITLRGIDRVSWAHMVEYLELCRDSLAEHERATS